MSNNIFLFFSMKIKKGGGNVARPNHQSRSTPPAPSLRSEAGVAPRLWWLGPTSGAGSRHTSRNMQNTIYEGL